MGDATWDDGSCVAFFMPLGREIFNRRPVMESWIRNMLDESGFVYEAYLRDLAIDYLESILLATE